MIPAGVLIVAAIVVPWYAELYRQHGWTYIRSFLVIENVERFTSGLGVGLHRPIWYYLPVVFSDSFPLSMFLPVAAVAAWRTRSRLEILLWCWIAAIVVFFSLSAAKQDLYIFPIVAAVAALGGLAVERGLSDPGWRRSMATSCGAAGVVLVILGAGVWALFVAGGRIYALNGAIAIGAMCVAGGIVVLVSVARGRPAAAALAIIATMIAVDWTFVVRVLPDFEKYKPVPEITAFLQQRLKPGDQVAQYRIALPSMAYYMRAPFEGIDSREEFIGFLRGDRHVYAVLGAEDYADVKGELKPGACVVSEWDFFQAKLKDIVSRRPLPKLVVVDNRCGAP
jgi:4-amino-4-deoxy-L-arabinose transferase-like glycosyltransferase